MVASRLKEVGCSCEIVTIRTSGDRLQDASLSEIGGKRLFVKELEDALLKHEIDLAVHSSKDLPAALPKGLTIGAVMPREDPHDVLVLRNDSESLPARPSLGTGSVRRIAQLTRAYPTARFAPIRGNLDTRLRKLDVGEHDALVLAAAGLKRLGFASRISLSLSPDVCVPAPGQGIVAIEIRDEDAMGSVLAPIDDQAARTALTAERALVEALGGGCQTPIGALATPVGHDEVELIAAVISLDGRELVRERERAPMSAAEELGRRVGANLISRGADGILARVRVEQSATGSPPPSGN